MVFVARGLLTSHVNGHGKGEMGKIQDDTRCKKTKILKTQKDTKKNIKKKCTNDTLFKNHEKSLKIIDLYRIDSDPPSCHVGFYISH